MEIIDLLIFAGREQIIDEYCAICRARKVVEIGHQ